jgi:glycosyltransferase involved in cell wall biosynthesis
MTQAVGSGAGAQPRVDILLTVYNGLPYLSDQIRSLQDQTHQAWRLWVRDDGSDDGTVDVLRAIAATDSRIRPLESDSGRLGALGGFGWLLEHAALDADYIMFCDADDVWLPTKIEQTLDAMLSAERQDAGEGQSRPVLVHTDLTVVGPNLEPIATSFWRFEGISPQPARLNRLLVHNTVTGCTVMINRALRQLAGRVPPEAVMHDWWLALTAVAFGRVVSVNSPTILYRQHGRNDTGARYYPRGIIDTVKRAWTVASRREGVREALQKSTRQAAAFLDRFGPDLSPGGRELTSRYARLSQCGPISRKVRLVQLGTLTQGWDRGLGLILRA